jgi:chloride channel protein, CIC family
MRLRQLVLFGRDGLPVLSHDGESLRGWITRNDVLTVLAQRVGAAGGEIERGALAAEFASDDPAAGVHGPPTPLHGYEIAELAVGEHSPARGRRLAEIPWPAGSRAVAVSEGREIRAARGEMRLRPGEHVILLAPSAKRER